MADGRLAAPAGADESDRLSYLHLQADLVENLPRASNRYWSRVFVYYVTLMQSVWGRSQLSRYIHSHKAYWGEGIEHFKMSVACKI